MVKKEKIKCHVCGKEKKPYIVILDNNILSLHSHFEARKDGEICERCDQYFAMTGELKASTDKEFEIAKKASWFARMVLAWWEREYKLNNEVDDGD